MSIEMALRLSIEMALRLAAEWRARTEPLQPVVSARRAPDPAPLPADELAWLEADLAARCASDPEGSGPHR